MSRHRWLDSRRAATRPLHRQPAAYRHGHPCRHRATARIAAGSAAQDTDWWIDRLYDFAAGSARRSCAPSISRTVIDVNRDPVRRLALSGPERRPGCARPTTFDGEPLYRAGAEPDRAEIDARGATPISTPYHAALAAEIDAAAAPCTPTIVLYDCHSIRSVMPRLFEGTLPDLQHRHQ